MEHPIKMDDLGGKPTIFGKHSYVFVVFNRDMNFANTERSSGRHQTLFNKNEG